jgi:hypothetical protein
MDGSGKVQYSGEQKKQQDRKRAQNEKCTPHDQKQQKAKKEI